MKQPKPMVRQIWKRSRTNTNVSDVVKGECVTILGVYDDLVSYGEYTALPSYRFAEEFYFVPQNDLEFAAVNLDKWYFAADHIHVNGGTLLVCHESVTGAISYEQWKSERYRLGLDTKPHYKLINGQWSETK